MSALPRWVLPGALAVLAAAAGLLWAGAIGVRAFDAVFAIYVGIVTGSLMARFGSPHAGTAALATAAVPVLLLALVPEVRTTPYLAVFTINLGVGWVFLSGLRPGRVPVILQLIEQMQARPETDARFQRFVRGQCWIWTGLTGATAATGLLAMLWAEGRPALSPLMSGLLLGQVGFFLASHRYAIMVHGRAERTLNIVRAMSRPSTWTRFQL